MSYIECPDCGKQISVFGESHIEKIAADLGIPVLTKLPIRPATAAMIDHGDVESVPMPEIAQAVDFLTK